MMRELKEEAGLNPSNINLDAFLGAYLDGKIDHHTGDFVNWIILGYRGTLVSGEVKNMEPDRCVGIEKFELDKVPFNEVGQTATKFIKMMQKK
jgi:8-oxo-dGTP pyrophosphatase MutT (NUDIX family)